jgi:hypothetical protein
VDRLSREGSPHWAAFTLRSYRTPALFCDSFAIPCPLPSWREQSCGRRPFRSSFGQGQGSATPPRRDLEQAIGRERRSVRASASGYTPALAATSAMDRGRSSISSAIPSPAMTCKARGSKLPPAIYINWSAGSGNAHAAPSTPPASGPWRVICARPQAARVAKRRESFHRGRNSLWGGRPAKTRPVT